MTLVCERAVIDPDDHRSSELSIEPMSPAMADRLDRFHERLSPGTVRRRFFSAHPHLTPDELRRFTDVDHLDREALVAIDADGELAGVARFDRLAPHATTAEVAFVVADDWQHHGLGSRLFALLADRARSLGVERFVAETLIENRAMRAVFWHCGHPVAEKFEGGVASVTIDLCSTTETNRR